MILPIAKQILGLKHMMLTVLGIYHPPNSNQSHTTNLDFLDEFTDWMAEHAMSDTNVIILGDSFSCK